MEAQMELKSVSLADFPNKQCRILEAASQLFARNGYDGTSIHEIASMAGLGKGTIYLYFKGKEDILEALAVSSLNQLDEAINTSLEGVRGGGARLNTYLNERLKFFEQQIEKDKSVYRAILEAKASPVLKNILADHRTRHAEMILSFLYEGIEAQEFAVEHPSIVNHVLLMSLDAVMQTWATEGDDISPREKSKNVVEVLLKGVLVR